MTHHTALCLSASELDEAIRAADPLAAPGSVAVDRTHLSSAGAVLTHRLAVEATATEHAAAVDRRVSRPWRRRLLGVAAAAVVLPTAAVLVGPSVAARLGDHTSGGPFVGTAVASDGRLTCDGGGGKTIAPDTAAVRLWPTALPAGWKVTGVSANQTWGTDWCTAPSLVAVRTDRTGLITGTVQLTGPVAAIDTNHLGIVINEQAKTALDRIGAYRAIRFTARDNSGYHTWVITDGSGAQWFAAVNGYPLARARAVLAAATLGRTVTWNAHRAPGLAVVQRRTGEPYPTTVRDGLDWYLDLDAHGVQRQMEVWDGPDEAPVASRADVGERLITVHGTQMLVSVIGGHPNAVYADTASGAVAWSDVAGDLPQAEARLLSLRNLPTDDPRLHPNG